jgi:predicted nucleic acid-binding protein
MLQRILVDTGPLVALASPRDEHHARCVEQLRFIRPPLLTCWPVLTEAAWLLRAQPTSVERILASVRDGLVALLAMDASSAAPISRLLEKYRKLGAQLADAALVYLAERERIDTIFTLDRRDFAVYRTIPESGSGERAGRRLKIVPA